MPPRRCLKCHLLFTGDRCPRYECSSREAHGYGTEHQAARARLAETLPTRCAYCPEIIREPDRWVPAHVVDGCPPTDGESHTRRAMNERRADRSITGAHRRRR